MRNIPGEKEDFEEKLAEVGEDIIALLETAGEPMVVLNSSHRLLAANKTFENIFFSGQKTGDFVSSIFPDLFESTELEFLLKEILSRKNEVSEYSVSAEISNGKRKSFGVRARRINKDPDGELIFLCFRETVDPGKYSGIQSNKNFKDILAHAPAMICLLRGENHTFEVANEHYLQVIGHRKVKGKTVREVLPEIENQGFFELLDTVYSTGKPYVGEETLVRILGQDQEVQNKYLDFLYQPTRDAHGNVDGIFVHAVDVTEKVEARKKLLKSKNRLRILLDSMPAMVWMADREGNNVYLNKNWYRYTGRTRNDVQSSGWISAVHPEHRDLVRNLLEKAGKEQKEFNVSFKLQKGNGEYRWIASSGTPRFDAEGEFEGMIGTLVDVHEEKLKEELIREKEHRIRSIVEEADVATALYIGEEMRVELANDAMIEVWGKDRSVIGKELHEALPELQGQPFLELLKKAYSTGKTYWGKEDKVVLMRDGEPRTGYFSFTYKPLRGENGEVYGILNMALDVTEMVVSKARLKESEAHFRLLADLMPEKVSNSDAKGNFIYFNQNWLQYTGLSSKELQKDGWVPLVHPEERETFEKNWSRSLATGEEFEMELRFIDKFGKYKWHLSRAEAVRDENGHIKMWIGNHTEIQKLKEEEKRKEDFLKMVSHELKTPVTSIKGYVQLLLSVLKNKPNEENTALPVVPSLERIDHQIQRLTRLISEMLDLSRIEENKLQLQKTCFSLNELVEDTVQDISYTNSQHQISVQHNFRGDVYADKDRIGQVLINLITNAIKYSPESDKVQVLVEQEGETRISVAVKDQGIGIDPKNHKSIFKRFYRAGVKSEETYSGFGIGLYLAKEIMQRHSGDIGVRSEVGKGSEFFISLDLAQSK